MRFVRALGLGLVAAALFTLLLEGALSLAGGASLRERIAPRGGGEPGLALEREQAVAARATPGPYRVAEDPLVGFTLKLEGELELDWAGFRARVRSDALGLRARGVPAPESAVRVVVLGDELAFGLGLEEDESLAAVLERQLAPRLGGRALVCTTVALPGWSGRNAVRFLLDHLAELAPELVLYVPGADDLADAYGVDEAGHLRAAPDPSVPEPLLEVRGTVPELDARLAALSGATGARLGPEVLSAGSSASSRLRLALLAQALTHASTRLARTGARLVLAFPEASVLRRELLAELAREGLELPQIALFEGLRPEDLQAPAHLPTAATTALLARWIADAVCARGWLAGAEPADSAPATPAPERRATELGPAAALEESRVRRAAFVEELEARLVPAELAALRQVYGGLGPDDTLGARFAAVLRPGARLRVRLEPLAARADLYPLEVRVRVDEHVLGSVFVPAEGLGEAVFELPPSAAQAALEVRLEPRDWAVIERGGLSFVAAAHLRELASLP